MTIRIAREDASTLAEYARVPIAFEVRETLGVTVLDSGLGGLVFHVEPVPTPYAKDYDQEPGNHPTDWPRRFDLREWAILAAWEDEARVGGAVVAWNTPGVESLEGRSDLPVLWDLRVAPGHRGRGVGAALFRAAAAWSAERGARQLAVETQNVNVGACRFYARQGCVLGAVHRFAYPTLPLEVQLRWYMDLTSGVEDAASPARVALVRAGW
ncbi:MAG TPA: GNAT family N-acetyltransferase [Gemmatimonadaceae bacterium]|nr:GNAT family N-acetyltransferase [Gemmatimonadaceae bacterium]